jgi:F-type H+-transporting ATPase subunit delta
MDDMLLVHDVCAENHILNVVLDNPTIREVKKVAVIHDLFTDKVSKTTLAFLAFVVKKRRTINLKGISEAYMDIFRDSRGIVLSHVTTAETVDAALLEELSKKVADYTGKRVEMVNSVDNKMLGGFCMTYNNNMYDARLLTKVVKLRKEFSKNIYEKKF